VTGPWYTWLGAAVHIANSRDLDLVVLYCVGLEPMSYAASPMFDASYGPIAVSAFIAFGAQRNNISRAGQGRLEKRRRSTASAAAHGVRPTWA
jgi:hypothetical protein